MKDFDRNDPVWKLLGQSRKVKVDPFFSRNVTREVRKNHAQSAENDRVAQLLFSLLRRPAFAGVAAAAAVLVLAFISTQPAETRVAEVVPAAVPAEFDPTEEIESIGYLGELMAISDPADLDDAALADLSLLASR